MLGEDQRFDLNCLSDVGFATIFPIKSIFIGPQPPFYAMKSKEKTIIITGFPLLTPVAGEGLEPPYCRQLKVTPPCSSQRKKN